jgi:N-methylhydantoinase A
LDAVCAAAAVYRMVTANMSNAVRTVTVERGHDPRRFAMVAYGGALGIFAADIARTAGIACVVVPADAAVFSAHGLLASDDVRTRARSAMWTGGDASGVAASLRELEAELVGSLTGAGYSSDRIEVRWQGEFKFSGQQWEITVPIPRKNDLGETDLEALREDFPRAYEAEYGAGTAWVGSPVLLMSVRVVATGRVRSLEPTPAALPAEPPVPTPTGRRRVHLPLTGEDTDVPVYDAPALNPGAELEGPAVVEHPLTTIQVPPGWRLRADEWGNYVMTDTTHAAQKEARV